MNSRVILYLVIVLGFGLLCFFPRGSEAQTNLGGPSDTDVSIQITPAIPGPKEEFTVTLKSYLFELDKALMTWSVNGVQISSDYGRTSLQATTGALGEKTTVFVAIVATYSGKEIRIDKKLVIEPAQLDLLWEAADSYVPPFYEGKALPASEAIIKVVAMPNTPHIETRAKTLSYAWNRNFDAVPSASGYGKQMLVLKHDYLKDVERIAVTASDTTGSYATKSDVSISPVTPHIYFYEKRPSLGVQYQYALGDGFSVESGERTLIAEPYFFSPRDKLSNTLSYKWKVGTSAIATPVPRHEITFKAREGASGASIVTIEVESIPKLFQKVAQSIQITLGS